VEHTQFDHTSLLRYLVDKWNLGPLGARTAAATGIGLAIRESAPRTDTVPFIRVPYTVLIPPHPDWEQSGDGSNHHQALAAFAKHLQELAGAPPLEGGDLAGQAASLVDNIKNGVWKLQLGALGRGAA
jgi:phospholipase C